MIPQGTHDSVTDEGRLRRLVARVARVEPNAFGSDDDLRTTLGLDSLSSLRVAAAMEREFGVVIPDEHLHELATIRDMLGYLRAAKSPIG